VVSWLDKVWIHYRFLTPMVINYIHKWQSTTNPSNKSSTLCKRLWRWKIIYSACSLTRSTNLLKMASEAA